MKRSISVLVVTAVCAAVWATSALAWHVDNAIATASCNSATGTYTIDVSVTPNSQYPNPLVTDISPTSVPGNTTGSVKVTATVVWSTSSDTQSLTLYTPSLNGDCTMPAPPPAPSPTCPDGTTQDSSSTSTVLVCVKTVTNTVTVTGPTVTNTVYGTPAPCVAPAVQTGSGDGSIQCTVTVTNTVTTPGPVQYVSKTVRVASAPKTIVRNHYIKVPAKPVKPKIVVRYVKSKPIVIHVPTSAPRHVIVPVRETTGVR